MHKIKTTQKAMRENYFIIGIGYCNAQYLLNVVKPIAYSAGVYGWQCDYYDVDGVVISTGYNYINNQNTVMDYDTIRKYDNKACKLLSQNKPYDVKKKQVRKLLSKMIKQAKGLK
jgi:hypothetical protein